MIEEMVKEIEKMFELNPQYLRLGCLYDHRNSEEYLYCIKINCVYSKAGRKEGETNIDVSKRGLCRDMLEAFGFKLPPYD